MCPGGDKSALEQVLPLLQKVAAKDKDGKSCVGIVGRGGSGHYVKMVHNGIEHGMMSAICEAWGIMRKMGMKYEEIGDVLKKWNSFGELVSADLGWSQALSQADEFSYRKTHFSSPLAPISLINASLGRIQAQMANPNNILLSYLRSLTKWSRT